MSIPAYDPIYSRKHLFQMGRPKTSRYSPDWESTGDGTKVGLFLPLPASFDRLFPLKDEDGSAAHLTYLIIGEVPEDQREEVLDILRDEISAVNGPVRITANEIGYFDNKKGQKIAHLVPEISESSLEEARVRIIERLRAIGIEPKDYGTDKWKPHITLGYLEPDEEWEEDIPEVDFHAAELELWGWPEAVSLPFGMNKESSVLSWYEISTPQSTAITGLPLRERLMRHPR